MEQLFKTLASESRLRIINILIQGKLCVSEIETLLDMSQTNVSRHLSKLKSEKIVDFTKDALWTQYQINDEFLEMHKDLYQYLSNEFTKQGIYLEDIEKYNRYKNNNLCCSDIRKDKNRVVRIISNGG